MKSTANRGADRRLWFWLALAALAALGLRSADLGGRAVHTDEAVNAVIVGDMLAGSPYRYDPRDHHGPAFYYLEYGICRLAGIRSLAAMEAGPLRAGAALASSGTILALGLLAEESAAGALLAALFLALGSPFVFYGRYAIHESLLLLAMTAALGAAWRFWRRGSLAWAGLSGLALGIAAATKESAPALALAAAAAFALCLGHRPTRELWRRRRADALTSRRAWTGAAVGAALAAAALLAFFSSFGRNPAGLRDAVRGLALLSARVASGAGHEKPWWTYLRWLARPEPLGPPWFGWSFLVFGGAGAGAAFSKSREAPLTRFLAVYSGLVLILCSVTPYKTPWLLLDFLVPGTVVAGFGLAATARAIPAPWPSTAVAAACLAGALLARESIRLCFRQPDNPLSPYAYSPTSSDLTRLARRLDALAAESPDGRNLLIEVAAGDYWPLPWYLRHFPRVGYWGRLRAHPAGDVVIASLPEEAAADAALGPAWHREYFGLRQDMLVVLYWRDPRSHG